MAHRVVPTRNGIAPIRDFSFNQTENAQLLQLEVKNKLNALKDNFSFSLPIQKIPTLNHIILQSNRLFEKPSSVFSQSPFSQFLDGLSKIAKGSSDQIKKEIQTLLQEIQPRLNGLVSDRKNARITTLIGELSNNAASAYTPPISMLGYGNVVHPSAVLPGYSLIDPSPSVPYSETAPNGHTLQSANSPTSPPRYAV
jgi:hypothetical protein